MPRPQGFSSEPGLSLIHLNAVQLQLVVDAWITSRTALITARQDAALAGGHYWQGLPTHTAVPAHTSLVDGATLGNNLASSPTDQAATWVDTLPELQTDMLPSLVRIDVYNGPAGKGWVMVVETKHNGDSWRKLVNVGPETYRAKAWHQVVS